MQLGKLEHRLLIDIGNSKIKIASAAPVKILKTKDIPYTVNSIFNLIKSEISKFKKYDFEYIAISNPFHLISEKIVKLIRDYFGIYPLVINIKLKSPLVIKYEETLGTDRICSALGARFDYKNKNILVVDFGTATTYNLISYFTFKGGLICPGILTSLDSLDKKTKLNSKYIKFPARIINSKTDENINGGVLYSSLFTFERIVQETKKEYGNLFVILTGGLSGFISKKTKIKHTVDKYILFKGMNYFIDYNTL